MQELIEAEATERIGARPARPSRTGAEDLRLAEDRICRCADVPLRPAAAPRKRDPLNYLPSSIQSHESAHIVDRPAYQNEGA